MLEGDTLSILEQLIAFQTVSRDSNLDLIDAAEAYLTGVGARCRRTYDAGGRKANLLASFGDGEGGIVFSGHTDVVPIDGQDWATDPFVMTIDGDRAYGRGVADMKGFIAVVLAAAPGMANSGRPFHIALSYDEEVGCLGAPALVADLVAAGLKPSGCVIGEPTGMRPIVGHKGAAAYAVEVRGLAVHSSLAPQGVNAIYYAARVLERLRQMGEALKAEEPRDDGYDVPYSTISPGVITGGAATNIVPEHCTFRFDLRHLPGTRPETLVEELRRWSRDTLEPEMREVSAQPGITIRRLGVVPAFQADRSDPFIRRVERACASNGAPAYVAFGTEAGIFQEAGVPTIVCGPGHIEQAHKPDEFVDLNQLTLCEAFVAHLIGAEENTGA
ncbi:acetylornithine deacetylase [Caulobacter sp.]|uniref:acetylornithine deacetylase n=1 Tax=Caulobacter sp. TaxID=78 RepID=UPI0031D63138